jgi:hypothetical protein
VQKAVSFVAAAVQDFDLASPYAKANFGPGPSDDFSVPYLRGFHFGWLATYHARFGDDENITALKSAAIDLSVCSDSAVEEQKLEVARLCRSGAATELPLAKSLLAMGQQPNIYMGYGAACLQATRPFALGD